MTILYTNLYEVIGLKCCFYVFFLILTKINNFWSLECLSLHFPAMPLLFLGKADFGVPHRATVRPWNVNLSYLKAETSKASNAYWKSRKLPEVTQPRIEGTGTWGPPFAHFQSWALCFQFPLCLSAHPYLQLCVIRPQLSSVSKSRQGHPVSLGHQLFHKVTR